MARDRGGDDPEDRTRRRIAWVVTGVWAASFVASLIPELEYDAPHEIHGIMLVVAGYFFAGDVVRRIKRVRNGDES